MLFKVVQQIKATLWVVLLISKVILNEFRFVNRFFCHYKTKQHEHVEWKQNINKKKWLPENKKVNCFC